jgi:hypothetical protein
MIYFTHSVHADPEAMCTSAMIYAVHKALHEFNISPNQLVIQKSVHI